MCPSDYKVNGYITYCKCRLIVVSSLKQCSPVAKIIQRCNWAGEVIGMLEDGKLIDWEGVHFLWILQYLSPFLFDTIEITNKTQLTPGKKRAGSQAPLGPYLCTCLQITQRRLNSMWHKKGRDMSAWTDRGRLHKGTRQNKYATMTWVDLLTAYKAIKYKWQNNINDG